MPIVGISPTGLKLCAPCWNGMHWTKGNNGHMTTNHCEHGGCQCPCPQMPNDIAGINLRLKETRKRNKESQNSLFEPTPEVKPRAPRNRQRAMGS